jgi:NTP pyrophosphatase (non-canonical NTP hydrolase)
MQLRELQDVIARTYLERDTERGVAVTIAWLAEEVGELARAVLRERVPEVWSDPVRVPVT